MKPRVFLICAAAIVLVTLVRVAATYRVFSEVWDDNVHVAGGHEWWTGATYHIDPEHPPLARILFAFASRSLPPAPSRYINFSHFLFAHDGRYQHNVTMARIGNLPFLLLAMVVTALWTRRLFGDAAAIVALLIAGSLPPILAHAGVATTDMPAAATLLFALYASDLWLDAPTWRRTLLLGIAIGIGTASKFSFLPFFPIAFVLQLAAKRKLPSPRLIVSLAIAFLVVWGTYKFAWGTMEQEYAGMSKATAELLGSARIATVPLPAPAFFIGVLAVRKHDLRGHSAYLLGHVSQKGWWDYFPIALAVKTPIPVLILFVLGGWMLFRARQHIELVLIVFAILGFTMTTHINIGVRHLLPLYPLMAIVAAHGATRARPAAAVLLAWLVVGAAVAHPDYLPWFNAFAGREPYHILVDSNFDWGQDLLRLARACRQRRIASLHASLFTPALPADVGLPPVEPLDENTPSDGWAAISETNLQVAVASRPHAFEWLTQTRSYERIGKSIRLYAPAFRSAGFQPALRSYSFVRSRTESTTCSTESSSMPL
jgi:4-amino-4-deoxy-L-arabinose transferase-like glycosyltransferase